MKLTKNQEDQLGWIAENCDDDHARNNNNNCAYCECATMAGCKPYSARTLMSLRKKGLIQIWDSKSHVHYGQSWMQLTEDNCRHLDGNGVYFCRTTPKYDEWRGEKKAKKLERLTMTLSTVDKDLEAVFKKALAQAGVRGPSKEATPKRGNSFPRFVEIEDHWVNPDHVTSIQPQSSEQIRNSGHRCLVWVVGNEGYHTYSIRSTKSASEVAALINQ